MVERRIELDRRYMRKDKMFKLKKKLGTALGADREKIVDAAKHFAPPAERPSLYGDGNVAIRIVSTIEG